MPAYSIISTLIYRKPHREPDTGPCLSYAITRSTERPSGLALATGDISHKCASSLSGLFYPGEYCGHTAGESGQLLVQVPAMNS